MLENIKWVKKVEDAKEIMNELFQIADDILAGDNNSLF